MIQLTLASGTTLLVDRGDYTLDEFIKVMMQHDFIRVTVQPTGDTVWVNVHNVCIVSDPDA